MTDENTADRRMGTRRFGGSADSRSDAGSGNGSEGGLDAGISRRELLQVAAAAIVAAPMVRAGAATPAAPAALPPKFFTAAEFAMVDELTEMIIPADAHSPGARAAQVAAYLDARLAESLEPDWKETWRSGLKLIDALSREMHGKTFVAGSPAQRTAVLERVSKNEAQPSSPEEGFFKELKQRTVRGYYTTKIGIHVDQQYKGNVYQRGEFAGEDVSK